MAAQNRPVPLKDLTIEGLIKALEERLYVADRELATALYLAIQMRKPLLIEGEPGCGKTEVAKVLAEVLGTTLIRLQCYEGLDASDAIYEWDYPRQLLYIKMLESRKDVHEIESEIFSERFLLKRPLLKAVMHDGPVPPVLLVDEIDRADEEFEGFLLEFLAEYQVTIPEIGTIKAKTEPIAILTSNRTREIGDGLKRRCLYYYVTYPPKEKELRILRLKVKGLNEGLAEQLVNLVNVLRSRPDVMKKPGISETLDWANAMMRIGAKELNRDVLKSTLICVIKSQDDLMRVDVDSLLSTLSRMG
ncbi:MAG: MoxR family ATPase [Thaumarchaeota archaeon]|nr:MoxR family ATPase [Candidatus Calditenuaceae archaeon]MCX8203129.1 MoxR family ATPase [Nitrososphaeria archaeon]MDW8043496.1 MoxR family ATPase [Nitrososphaerota archaeon]